MPFTPGFEGLSQVYGKRINQVGWAQVFEAIRQSTDLHNQAFNNLLTAVAERAPAVQERIWLQESGTLQPLDEWGRPIPAHGEVFNDLAYPLHIAGDASGANRIALTKMTVEEADRWALKAYRADADWNIRHMLAATFYNAPWVYADKQFGPLTVQPLAAGEPNVFYPRKDGTLMSAHNHYGAQVAGIADATNPYPAIKTHLTEHLGNSGPVVVYINNAERAATEALTGFVPVVDSDIQVGSGTDALRGAAPAHLGEEVIGKTDGVWVVEWNRIPANYMLAHIPGVPWLGYRDEPEAELQNLYQVEVWEGNLKTVEFYRHRGYGVRNRVGAYCYMLGAAAYVPPAAYAFMPLPI